jgi:hypothetical protein
MTFKPVNLVLQSVPPNPPNFGLPQFWAYLTTDDAAVVMADDYFNYNGTLPGNNLQFFVGDQVYCVCGDGVVTIQIAGVGTPGGSHVTTDFTPPDIAPGSITHAMLGSKIVEAGNIADATITTTQISATAGIVGTQLAAGTLTATELSVSVPQVIRVPITSANFKSAYTAGLAMIPAAGANTIIVVNSVTYTFGFLTAAYTAGGAIGLQYSTAAPVHAAGFAASATVAAADVTGLVATGHETALGAMAIASDANVVNKGVWFTVASADFATGSGPVVANISYQVITV